MFVLGFGIQSCSDNTDFSKPHILTDDEMAELLRQQRVRDSLMNVINADSIVVTTVNMIASASSYDGVKLIVDHHAAAQTFGLSDEEVIQSIQNLWNDDDYVSGYPEFTAFAIENTTHADNFGPQTQAGGTYGWGHWWNSKGDVCEWNYTNNDEAVYTSFYSDLENGVVYCDLGQYPGQLYDGEHINIMEGLRYTDSNEVTYRVVYVFDIYVGELGDIEGDVVATLDLEGNIEYNGNYETSDIPVDIDNIVSLVGAPSWEDLQWVALNPDGSYWQEQDAGDGRGNGGFWFGQDGYKGSWGDEASVFMCFPTDVYVEAFSAAPMPGVFTEGNVATIHCAATYEGTGKIVEINMTITVGAAASMDGDVVYNSEYNVAQSLRTDYSYSLLPIDVEAVCNALGITSLLDAKVVSYDAEGTVTREYTANNGFWFNVEGNVDSYGNSVLYVEYGADNDPESDDYKNFHVGMHPDLYTNGYVDGTVVPVKIGFFANDKLAMMTMNWQLGAEDEGFVAPTPVEGGVVYEAMFEVTQMYRDDYSSSLMPFDALTVMTKLGVSSLADAQIIGVAADGSYTNNLTGNNGFWYGMDGYPASWGASPVFIEYHPDSDPTSPESSSLCVGMFPELYEIGYTDGTVIPLIFGFKKGDNIALLTIKWKVGSSDEGFVAGTDYDSLITNATNVLDIPVTLDCPINNDYEGGIYEFDLNSVVKALGVTSLSEAMTFAQLPDGSAYYQGEDPAYWYGAEGYVDGWGPDGRVFIAYYGYDEEWPEDEYTLYAGLMPEGEEPTCKVGDTYKVVYGLYANDKKVTFTITVNVVANESASAYSVRTKSFKNNSQPYYLNLQNKAHKNR